MFSFEYYFKYKIYLITSIDALNNTQVKGLMNLDTDGTTIRREEVTVYKDTRMSTLIYQVLQGF